MPDVYEENNSKVVITNILNYTHARMQVDTAEEFIGTEVISFPQYIQLLRYMRKSNPMIANKIRFDPVDTVSGEYHLRMNGDKAYIMAHGNHPFKSSDRLFHGWHERMRNAFMQITEYETQNLIKNIIPIVDLRKGYDASNQNILINLDKDKPSILKRGARPCIDDWMIDDRILAACGSEDNRTWYVDFLFNQEKIARPLNTHRIHEFSFDIPVGRLLYTGSHYNDDGVMSGYGDRTRQGRFVAIKGITLSLK